MNIYSGIRKYSMFKFFGAAFREAFRGDIPPRIIEI